MDINLTGQIATNLAENLKPAWYNPLLNAGAGIIGGIVTGGITLLALWINNRKVAKRIQRDERKEIYLDFLPPAIRLSAGSRKPNDVEILTKSISAIFLLGSPKVIFEINKSNIDAAHLESLKKALPALISLMAEEIQGFDVYASAMELDENMHSYTRPLSKAKISGWWKFWKKR